MLPRKKTPKKCRKRSKKVREITEKCPKMENHFLEKPPMKYFKNGGFYIPKIYKTDSKKTIGSNSDVHNNYIQAGCALFSAYFQVPTIISMCDLSDSQNAKKKQKCI